jgi:O-antigen/teichoic acid export membrane protein
MTALPDLDYALSSISSQVFIKRFSIYPKARRTVAVKNTGYDFEDNKTMLTRFERNVTGTLARQLLVILFGLVSAIILARVLGPEGNGLYTLSILLPTVLSTFLNLGAAPANVYFIGRGTVDVRNALFANLWLWLILSVLGILVGAITIWSRGDVFFPGVPRPLLWGGVAVFPLVLLQAFLISLLQGKQDFRRFNTVSIIAPGVMLVLFLALVWGLSMEVPGMEVPGALLAYGIGYLVALVLTIRAVWVHCQSDIRGLSRRLYAKQCIDYGWKAHLSNILAFVNYRADIFLVNFFLTPALTGIYVIAVQIAERLWLLSQAVSTVLLPRLSELYQDEKKRNHLTPVIARWVFIATFFAAVLLVLVAKPLIVLLFGSKYINATGALIWLLPGIVLGSLSRILSNDIAARGKPELNMYVAFFVVSVNIIANIILIPMMGINGAALATTIAYSLNAIAKLYLYTRLSGNMWWQPLLLDRTDIALIFT